MPEIDGGRIETMTDGAVKLRIEARGRKRSDVLDEWVASADARGARLVARHDYSDSADLVLASGEHAYLVVSGDAEWGFSAVLGRATNPSPPRAPGRCVSVPKASVRISLHSVAMTWRGERSESAWIHTLETAFHEDIDADGMLDAWVPIAPNGRGRSCPQDTRWKIYVMRGTCGHLLGTVGPGKRKGADLDLPPLSSGFRPLTFTFEEHVLRQTKKLDETPLRVHALRFEVVRAKYQRVADDVEEHTVKCQHCPSVSCTLER